jgi:hypothetical protein
MPNMSHKSPKKQLKPTPIHRKNVCRSLPQYKSNAGDKTNGSCSHNKDGQQGSREDQVRRNPGLVA